MTVEILEPHGLCAGVNAAIAKALKLRNVYCLHELVHQLPVRGASELDGRSERGTDPCDTVGVIRLMEIGVARGSICSEEMYIGQRIGASARGVRSRVPSIPQFRIFSISY